MGYLPKRRTRELVCDLPGLEPEEGAEPLRATVVSSLTFDDLDAIPSPVTVEDGKVLWRTTPELRAAIAPYVTAWNCEAIDRETGKPTPLPPPAEAGPDVFRATDWLVTVWLALELKQIHVSGRDPKGTTSSAPTAESSPAGETATPADAPANASTPGRGRKRRPAQT